MSKTDTSKTPQDDLDKEVAELLETANEDDVLAAVSEVENEEAKAAIYESQAAPTKGKGKTRKAKAPAKPKTKRVSTASMKVSDAVKTVCGEDWSKFMAFEKADADLKPAAYSDLANERVASLDGVAKKQGEKIVNLFKWLKNGGKLRGYSEVAIKLLVEKGEFTCADLRDRLIKQHKGKGTANSVSHQYMNILPLLKIASKDGKKVVLNKDSTILETFRTNFGV